MPRRKTTKEFIEKARAKHGDRYDYSKVVYVRTRDKVIGSVRITRFYLVFVQRVRG